MKHLMCILVLFWLVSCNEPEKNTVVNEIETLKNGNEWKGSTEINLYTKTDTLIVLGTVNERADEVIAMKIKFEGPGTYTLTSDQASYYTTIGGDVIASEYKLDPGGHSEVEVFSYDTDSKAISGRFELKLKKDRSILENDTEYLNFTDGLFRGDVRSVDW